MKEKIKLILKSVREYKKYAILSPIFMIFEAAMECAIPYVMTLFLGVLRNQNALGEFDIVGLLPYIFILLGMAIFSVTAGILGAFVASKASCGLAKNLRHDVYKKLQGFSFSNIDKFQASSLITRMTTDINNVQMSFQMCIRIVVRAPLMLIFSIVMAFLTGGNLAFIFIALIPLIILGFILIVSRAMGIFRRVFKRYDALNESVQENVTGVRVVKSYVREQYEQDKFNKASDSIANEFIKAEKLAALSMPIMNTSIHLSNILVLALGSMAILYGWGGIPEGFKVESMSALITYGIQVLMSLMMISMILIMFVMSMEGINRVGEVLMEESNIVNPENPIYEVTDGSVVFDNVNFKYKKEAENNTLSNLNLTIKSGEFIGILGSTGSGKTSFVNLISRLYDVSEGNLLVGGHNVKEYDLKTLRDNVAVVLQKNVLFSGTIEENLRWGDINATQEEIEKACEIAQAKEIIEAKPNKYQDYIEQGGANMSGGQKQRICIARALLKKPKILILDDSTSAVDTRTDAMIRNGLKNSLPETTKIVIAQRISSIESADKIVILDNGQINDVGTHEELLARNAIYQEVYYSQNKLTQDSAKKGGK